MTEGTRGWLPKQHGAWAMLAIPFIVGAYQAGRAGSWQNWFIPLLVAEFAGYLTFATFGSWWHASPRQRPRYRRPLITYGVLTVVSGVATIVVSGPGILWWLVVAAPLFALALYHLWTKNDRALASGFATVALTSGIGLVLRFATPQRLVTTLGPGAADLAVQAVVFGYAFGTVLHVKSLIRERTALSAHRRSMGYHLAVVAAIGVAVVLGLLDWWWIVFGLALVGRTHWLHRKGASTPLTPRRIGHTEIWMSLALLVGALLS